VILNNNKKGQKIPTKYIVRVSLKLALAYSAVPIDRD
jgi:hypothetical protein